MRHQEFALFHGTRNVIAIYSHAPHNEVSVNYTLHIRQWSHNRGWFKKNWLNWTVNGASTHARQLVAVFQVLCSLYRLTCVGYTQNSLEFVSRSPLIHSVGRSFCLYTDSLFVQIGDSNDKCSSSFEVECWNEDETHAARHSIVAILLSTDAAARLG